MSSEVFSQILSELHSIQAFDLLTIATLAVLEGILSVDNALVLAILVRTLPKHQQKKALAYGIIGAFTFRLIALLLAAYLMRMVVFKLIGGGYLLYLAMKHMFFFHKEEAHQPRVSVSSSFWKTVFFVELTDIAFSIDSIMTAVAMTDKLSIVWLGGILGIISLRLLSGVFIRLLEKLPKLEDLAYQLIFFIGTKLTLEGFHVEIQPGAFWLMMGVIIVLGTALVYRDHHQRKTQNKFHNLLLRRLRDGDVTVEEVLALESIPREIITYLRGKNCLQIQVPRGGEELCDQQLPGLSL
jgi:YkoY family integral membrane protein